MSDILVTVSGWGNDDHGGRRAVLERTLRAFESVAGPIDRSLIVVERGPGPAPMLLTSPKVRRDISHILLVTGDRSWAQHVYQFAHELSHIVLNGESVRPVGPTRWIDEAICEIASFVSLTLAGRDMARNPPFPGWEASEQMYSQMRNEIEAGYRAQVDPRPIKVWLRAELPNLRQNPIDRIKNAKVALELLPIFERTPVEAWRAARALNTFPEDEAATIDAFFSTWERSAGAYGLIVREIAEHLL